MSLPVSMAGGGLLSGSDATFVALVALGTLVVLAMLFALVLLARRRLDSEVREVVRALEDLRSGVVRKRPTVDPRSPMVLVADAIHRLSHEWHSRWGEAEKAAERWKALTDASRDTAVITTDTDGDVRSFSSGATDLFGWEEDEVVSRPAAVLFEETSYKDLLPKLTRRNLRHRGITTRCSLVRRDGASFEAEASLRMLHGASGDAVGFLILVRDITEQVRSEAELRESEARYRGLIERLADGVLIVRGGRIAYVNRAAEAVLDAPGRELVGTPLRDRVATRDVLVVEEKLAAIERRSAEEDDIDCALVTAGGHSLDARVRASAVHYAGEAAVLLLIRDETGVRQAEREIRRNEVRLDAVLEAISDGVLVVGDRGDRSLVHIANGAFGEMFGIALDDLLGMASDELHSRLEASGPAGARAAELLESMPEGTVHDTVTTDAPEIRSIRLVATVLRDGRGGSVGRLLVSRDLSEQRRSEKRLEEQAGRIQLGKVELERAYRELHEAHGELRIRNGELDGVNEELRRLDKMKSDLLGNVSHELQTPLVSVRGYTEMILRERLGPINEEQRKGLERSLAGVDRMISMIDSLLAVARSESDAKVEGERTRFPVRQVVEEARELLRDTAAAKHVELSVDLDDPGPELEADRDGLLQVVSNLLSNAIKHGREGGRVDVFSVSRDPAQVELHIRDQGPGIPVGVRERVFERGFQVRGPGGEAPPGSGLGLSIVREIVNRHGGSVRVEGEEGKGADFVVTLPRADRPSTVPLAGPPKPPEAPTPPAADPPPADPPERPRLRIIRRQRSE